MNPKILYNFVYIQSQLFQHIYDKRYIFLIGIGVLAIFISTINNHVQAISIYDQGVNETSAAAANITGAETDLQLNVSDVNKVTKISSVNIKELTSPSPEMLVGVGETEEVIGTLAGYDNVRAYKLAKLFPSISDIITEKTEYTFDPSKSPSLLSSSITTDNSTNSTVVTTESESFVQLNQMMNNPLDMRTGCNNSCAPPDPVVAAGPDHVFQLVNVAGKIWTKDGSSTQYFSLNDFFNVSNHRLTDPYVIYDSISERWFASIFDVTTESYPLAVSLTNDPTGEWNIYDIKFVSCPDYGRFAVNNNLLVLSVNDFGSHCSDGFKGTQHAIIKKDDLLAGIDNVQVQITPPDITQFTMLPVQPITSSSTLYMVSSSGFGTNNLELLSITGEPPNAVITSNAIPIKQSDTPPQASQPGSQIKLDTLDGRISSASYFNDKIWATFTDRCFSPERSCIRLVEVDTQTNQPLQDFNYAAENANIYHPALSMDKSGNLIVAFGISSSSIFPSIMATGRTSLDDPNTLSQPVYLIEGSAATQIADDDQIARYGDYATAALESNSNIWITNEYNKDTRWSTFIGSLSH